MIKTKTTQRLLFTLPLLLTAPLSAWSESSCTWNDQLPEGHQLKSETIFVPTATCVPIEGPTPFKEAISKKERNTIQTLIENGELTHGDIIKAPEYLIVSEVALENPDLFFFTLNQLDKKYKVNYHKAPHHDRAIKLIRDAYPHQFPLLPRLFDEIDARGIRVKHLASDTLAFLAERNCLPGVKLLVDKGFKDLQGIGLAHAIENGNKEMVDYLLEKAIVDPHYKYFWKNYHLYEAVKQGDPSIVRALIAGLATARDHDGTVLAMSIREGKTEITNILLDEGVCVDKKGTALALAAEKGDLPLAKRIVKQAHAKDPEGRALEKAQEHKNSQMTNYLNSLKENIL